MKQITSQTLKELNIPDERLSKFLSDNFPNGMSMNSVNSKLSEKESSLIRAECRHRDKYKENITVNVPMGEFYKAKSWEIVNTLSNTKIVADYRTHITGENHNQVLGDNFAEYSLGDNSKVIGGFDNTITCRNFSYALGDGGSRVTTLDHSLSITRRQGSAKSGNHSIAIAYDDYSKSAGGKNSIVISDWIISGGMGSLLILRKWIGDKFLFFTEIVDNNKIMENQQYRLNDKNEFQKIDEISEDFC